MESNVNYTIVGIFILTLTTFIVLGIIWLSAGLGLESYTTYAVFMSESVSGLADNSTVEYNGVAVGTVKSIVINGKNPRLVEVLLDIKSSTPITIGTVATLTTRSLTGITFVSLKDNGKNLTPLRRKPGQKYAIIKTTPSLFLRMDAALSKLAINLDKITLSLQTLLSQQNVKSFSAILSNVDQVTHNLIAVSLALKPFVKSSTSSIQVFGTQTLPSATRTLNNLDTMTRNLIGVSDQMKENPAVLIRGTTPTTLGPGEQ